MAITLVGSDTAVEGQAFVLPAGAAAGHVVVVNLGSAANTSGVTFGSPGAGYVRHVENKTLRRAQSVWTVVLDGGLAVPSINCSAGIEYACSLAVFSGVDTSNPVASVGGPSLVSGLQLAIPSPGGAVTGGVAVGCLFVENDGVISNVVHGAIITQAGEHDGMNSMTGMVRWPSPIAPSAWTVGAVRWGTSDSVTVPANKVDQNQFDGAVTSSIMLNPA